MKKISLTLFCAPALMAVLLFQGCTIKGGGTGWGEPVEITYTTPEVSQERTALIGEVFYSKDVYSGTESGLWTYYDDSYREELTVTSIGETTMEFRYTEYTKPTGSIYSEKEYFPIRRVRNMPWREDASEARDLEIYYTEGTVEFEGMTFEIISATPESVTYRRIE